MRSGFWMPFARAISSKVHPTLAAIPRNVSPGWTVTCRAHSRRGEGSLLRFWLAQRKLPWSFSRILLRLMLLSWYDPSIRRHEARSMYSPLESRWMSRAEPLKPPA